MAVLQAHHAGLSSSTIRPSGATVQDMHDIAAGDVPDAMVVDMLDMRPADLVLPPCLDAGPMLDENAKQYPRQLVASASRAEIPVEKSG